MQITIELTQNYIRPIRPILFPNPLPSQARKILDPRHWPPNCQFSKLIIILTMLKLNLNY